MYIHQSNVRGSKSRLYFGGLGVMALSLSLVATFVFTQQYYQSTKQQLEQKNVSAATQETFTHTEYALNSDGEIIEVASKQQTVDSSTPFVETSLLSGNTSQQSNTLLMGIYGDDSALLKTYILQLESEPAAKVYSEETKKNTPKEEKTLKVKEQKVKIKAEHRTVKSDIERTIGKQLTPKRTKKDERLVSFEYDTAFNGITIEALPSEIDKIKSIKNIKRIHEDTKVETTLDVSVPMIKADQAWNYQDGTGHPLTGYGVTVGVIDTGVDYTHADLGGCFGAGCKVIGGYDFINRDNDPMDDHGHGTHVAATTAGNGLLLGMAPDAVVYAYKVLSSGGSGSSAGVTAAIDRCPDPNQDGDFSDQLDVCTLSLGGSGNPDDPQSIAADNAMLSGVIMTIAAGNSGPGNKTIGSPGTSRLAITVGAACKTGECNSPIASFSSRGPVEWTDTNGTSQFMNKPDIVAPGVNICAAQWGDWLSARACKDDSHIAISGTSMATPHVAGMAALLRQASPQSTALEIKDIIKNTAIPYSGLDENTQGKGLIDTMAALRLISPSMNFSFSLFAKPSSLSITSDITQATYTKDITLSIQNNESIPITATISTNPPVAGFTITPSQSSITIPAHDQTSVSATITLQNNQLISGNTYLQSIVFSWGDKQYSVPILVTIPNRLKFQQEIEYGIDNPTTQGIWTKELDVTVENLSSVDQLVQITSDCCKDANAVPVAGISFEVSPQSVTIPARGSTIIHTTLRIDNNSVPNGIYYPAVIVETPLQTQIKKTGSVYKYFATHITYSSDDPPYLIAAHNQGSYSVVGAVKSDTETILLMDELYSLIDIIGIYTNDYNQKYVVLEDIVPTGNNTIALDSSTATHEIKPAYKGIFDESLTANFEIQKPSLKFKTNNFPQYGTSYHNFTPRSFYTNNLSSDYVFSIQSFYKYTPLTNSETNKGINFEHILADGIDRSIGLTNGAADLDYIPLFGHPGTDDNEIFLDFSLCNASYGIISCATIGSDYTKLHKNQDFRYDLYTLPASYAQAPPETVGFQQASLSNAEGESLSHGAFLGFDPIGIKRWIWIPAETMIKQSANTSRLDVGLFPIHYAISWMISEDYKSINGLFTSPIRGQDWDANRFDLVGANRKSSYQISRDGQIIAEGSTGGKTDITSKIDNIPGSYSIELFDTAVIQNTTTSSSYTGSFVLPADYVANSRRYDLQPPTITDFSFLSNSIPSEVIQTGSVHQMVFALDPLKSYPLTDAISSVIVRMKSNVTDWQTLNYTFDTQNQQYSVSVPTIDTATLYSFELTALDSYANTLTYAFQLPSGTVPLGTQPTYIYSHVGDLDGSGSSCPANGNSNFSATIEIHNNQHQPVQGAYVEGGWMRGNSNQINSCTTNAAGRCEVSDGNECRDARANNTFVITKVSTDQAYNPQFNHDPDGDSNGSSIVIAPNNFPTVTPITISSVHIGNLSGFNKLYGSNPNEWNYFFAAYVHDQNHRIVPGATVRWHNSQGQSGSAITGNDGVVRYDVSISNTIPSVTYTIDSIVYSGSTYNQTDNHDPDGDSNGTQIIIYIGPTPTGPTVIPTSTPITSPTVIPPHTPSPTLTRTPTPLPTATPVPPTPTRSPTPLPTSTPIPPTPTRIPTPTGIVPTATRVPTATPLPTAIPLPTPTPALVLTSHIGDLDGVRAGLIKFGSNWKAKVTVRVDTQFHVPLGGATIVGQWTGVSGTTSCVTTSTGTCSITSSNTKNPSVTFTITSLSHPSYPYTASENHDPDEDSFGTTIEVRK